MSDYETAMWPLPPPPDPVDGLIARVRTLLTEPSTPTTWEANHANIISDYSRPVMLEAIKRLVGERCTEPAGEAHRDATKEPAPNGPPAECTCGTCVQRAANSQRPRRGPFDYELLDRGDFGDVLRAPYESGGDK